VTSALRFHQPVTGTVSARTPRHARKTTWLGYFMEVGGRLQLHASTADRHNLVVCTAALFSGSPRFKSRTTDELF
jgi:hypothetical protein